MAEKKLRATRPELWVANKTFFISGNLRVDQGDVIVDGHPILRAHKDAFRPFVPRFQLPDEETEAAPEPEPVAAPAEPEPEATPEPAAETDDSQAAP